MAAEAQRLVADFLTPEFLTRALRTDPVAAASLGPSGAVVALTIARGGHRGKMWWNMIGVVAASLRWAAGAADAGVGE